MPQKLTPKCIQCGTVESLMWRSVEIGQICQECFEQNRHKAGAEQENDNSNKNGDEKKTRKSTRITRYKPKNGNNTKTAPEGRSRRHIFKKNPFKAPTIPATIRTVESVFYKGSYLQIGDIVSLMDSKDNVYYAQIRGLLVDTFGAKSAFITWLIPTQASPSPKQCFDASTYLIGPEEDSPRSLSCMEFVMHAPSNYYHDKTTPFPPPDSMDFRSDPTCFIWTRLAQKEKRPIT